MCIIGYFKEFYDFLLDGGSNDTHSQIEFE